jgi:hypothetical protein
MGRIRYAPVRTPACGCDTPRSARTCTSQGEVKECKPRARACGRPQALECASQRARREHRIPTADSALVCLLMLSYSLFEFLVPSQVCRWRHLQKRCVYSLSRQADACLFGHRSGSAFLASLLPRHPSAPAGRLPRSRLRSRRRSRRNWKVPSIRSSQAIPSTHRGTKTRSRCQASSMATASLRSAVPPPHELARKHARSEPVRIWLVSVVGRWLRGQCIHASFPLVL